MAVTPNSLVTPQSMYTNVVTCTAAKTDLTNNTNAVQLIAAANNPDGGFVKRLWAIPRGSIAATQLQLYRASSGGALFLADSSVLPVFNNANGVAITKGDFGFSADEPMRLRAGEELWVGIGVAASSGIDFVVEFERF